MFIFTSIVELQQALQAERASGKSIGFVPTMGALHEGHLSLVKCSKESCAITVVSIFVNPTQFNNPEDLESYPRMPDKDAEMLNKAGADFLFIPDVKEMYPDGVKADSALVLPDPLAKGMEGAFRPGHFDGVVQVVRRLFEIVLPDKAFFGEKDFQQLAVIRYMTGVLQLDVEIVACPTYREKNGLAMSSRNLRLSQQEFEDASAISVALEFVRHNWNKLSVDELVADAQKIIAAKPSLKVEYFEIADSKTLRMVKSKSDSVSPRAFTAVYCGPVRLIDNMLLVG